MEVDAVAAVVVTVVKTQRVTFWAEPEPKDQQLEAMKHLGLILAVDSTDPPAKKNV